MTSTECTQFQNQSQNPQQTVTVLKKQFDRGNLCDSGSWLTTCGLKGVGDVPITTPKTLARMEAVMGHGVEVYGTSHEPSRLQMRSWKYVVQ